MKNKQCKTLLITLISILLIVTITTGCHQKEGLLAHNEKDTNGFGKMIQLPSEADHLQFICSSGVGGWSSELELKKDGAFSGRFEDMNAGETGTNYEKGTVTECDFTGVFGKPVQENAYCYLFSVNKLVMEKKAGDEWIENGIKHITTEVYGLKKDGTMVLWLPGTPVTDLEQSILQWVEYWIESVCGKELGMTLPVYVLYDQEQQNVYVSEQ